jgi:hypothetical protein
MSIARRLSWSPARDGSARPSTLATAASQRSGAVTGFESGVRVESQILRSALEPRQVRE